MCNYGGLGGVFATTVDHSDVEDKTHKQAVTYENTFIVAGLVVCFIWLLGWSSGRWAGCWRP